MAMTQEPIHWRYLPYIRPMYTGMYPQHMALYGKTYGTIPLGLGFMPAITGRTLFGLCSKSLRHCMILVFLTGFLYWIDIIPNILGMAIALNHQPTEVLNTAQINVVNLSGKKWLRYGNVWYGFVPGLPRWDWSQWQDVVDVATISR